MMTRREMGKLPPRSVSEINHVLDKRHFASLLSTVSSLEYRLETISASVGNGRAADTSWGITAVEHERVPACVQSSMMTACLPVPAVQQLSSCYRDGRFFHNIFINRMCDVDSADQQRQTSSAQHRWHTDGADDHPLLTVVYTIYNSEADSDSLSSHTVGGAVGMSNLDDGRYRRTSKSQPLTPQSWSTTTYFPKTNSFYIFPGYFVSHAVFKVYPGTVRYSIVMFLRLRSKFCGEKVDNYLRRQWALANSDCKKFHCGSCWSTFKDKRSLSEHYRRGAQKCTNRSNLMY